jgi:hypothetical protein
MCLKGKLDVQVDGEDIALLNGADPQCFVGKSSCYLALPITDLS